ncbi:NXPE family member 3-like [Mizuhopecten yessoensis]|uniref:NXPE family member 3-like n=1 Tax=Mizuhopecten yessoensis TaxID=6573 RepID=UPI000B45BC0D|nr:NXPE family member 3-like [Mizuhopecten yessoensis]
MWPKEDSWNTHPSGFYYKGRWQNVRCKITTNLPIPRYKRCFANRQLLLIGDSNVRIIGTRIINEMEFRLLKGNATSSIPQDVLAYEKSNNITLSMFPHQLPYYAHRSVDKTVFVSAAKRLDDIPAGDNRIILIHLWLHMLRSSVDTFRYHVRHIRQAIERLIQRSPNVHISIKGPHAYNYKDQLPVDYMASQHIRIWWEEFVDLHDKVIFLNEWDRTVGNENSNAHPNCAIDLISNFLAHVCDP